MDWAIASDPSLTAVLYTEPASGLIVDNAVVLEGSVFALHHYYGATHVLRLGPDLKTLGDKVVVRGQPLPVRLRIEKNYLIADVGTDAYRITPDLELVERDARGPQQKPGQMGVRMGPYPLLAAWLSTATARCDQKAESGDQHHYDNTPEHSPSPSL